MIYTRLLTGRFLSWNLSIQSQLFLLFLNMLKSETLFLCQKLVFCFWISGNDCSAMLYNKYLHVRCISKVLLIPCFHKLYSCSVSVCIFQLEIIEEGLHMKLELKNIKQQFLSILENYDSYEKREVATDMKTSSGIPLTGKPVSTPRARVRALYDARRARIQARRTIGSSGPTITPKRSLRRSCRESDKENVAFEPNTPHDVHILASDQKYGKVATSTPYCKPHKHCACHPRSTSQLLTPIKEEMFRPMLPFGTNSGMNTGTTSPTLSDLEGEYVTLRSPSQEKLYRENEDYMDIHCGPGVPDHSKKSSLTESKQMNDQTSIWINSFDNLGTHCPNVTCVDTTVLSPRRRESPVKYASSDVISELYTSKSLSNLKDVSQISRISRTSLREQSSGSNISGNLHSTFNYPLHSTLNYPLHSTLNMSGDDALTKQGAHLEEPDFRCISDARTTISEPSAVIRNPSLSLPKHTTPRSMDDSWMDIKSLRKVEKQQVPILTQLSSSSQSRHSNRSRSRGERTRRRERMKQKERETAQQTPTSHKEPQLCKEHGLHPTFGGPCIFQTDDSFTLTSETSEEEEHRPRSSTAVTETDNDSSYLSECMDESTHFSQGISKAEEYTATYDARNGRMRMLKRQTGQTELTDKDRYRDPVGLSESDFLDFTRKHFSLEATRSSLPDLSALSTTTSEADDPDADVSESTLHASQMNAILESSYKESDGFWSPNSLDDTMVSADRHNQRPLSISTSTTADTSPESTESRDLPVPVNSPNVTDSGSSRPTTDTYDYVDVPKFEIMGPPLYLPPRYQNPPRRRNLGSRPPCTVGKQATPHDTRSETRSEGRGARKCLHYHHDCDSGFSTPGSGRRTTSGKHIFLSDNAGNTRTVVQHSAVARNLQHDRKKQLVKKLKQFSSNFYKSTGNLHIHTLGHF